MEFFGGDSMTTQEVKRKLTAILSADVKGYSRLMGEDEEWTLRTLNAYKETMKSLIQQHRGRIVNAPGDNVLAEFASVVDAVQCGVEIQQVLRAKNSVLTETRRMDFRIGINLGDVIEEGEEIYGDGVNIAARLEGLAEPGGICISESAYQQIENKLPLRYDYLGEHEVKNIAKPVRAYRAQIESEATAKVISGKRVIPRQWQRAALAVGAILIVVVAFIAIWKSYIRPTAPSQVASKEKMAVPPPDAPSMAILPFVNMSGDPKQEFLCDGITEDIITAFSKVPGLFVMARNSVFIYKGKPVEIKKVGGELGVQYIIEGSVQRSANQTRITAQLIDVVTGHHLWAERYDYDLKDQFAVQDEIAVKVLMATLQKLRGQQGLTLAGATKYFRGKQGVDCYLKILEGHRYYYGFNIEDSRMARRIAEEAIAMYPEVPMSYVLMGSVHQLEYLLSLGKSPQESIERGMEMAQKALAMDDSIVAAHGLLSQFYTFRKDYEKALAEGERAVAMEPNGEATNTSYATNLNYAGKPKEAIPILEKALRYDPLSRGTTLLHLHFGIAFGAIGQVEEAVTAYRKAIHLAPNNIFAHLALAATYPVMGREEKARAEAAEVLKIDPKFSVDEFAKVIPGKDRSRVDEYINALRKAGLK